MAAAAAPALLAAILCAYQLGSRGLWLDEAASFSIASQHGAALGSALARDGGNMLGYYALLHVLISAFGTGAVVLRLPSVLGAAAAVALTAAIAARIWDRRAALLAGVLAAVSLTLVYWGQDARAYALMVALIAASWLALLFLVEPNRPAHWPWTAYVGASVAAMYMGLPAALIFPVQLLAIVWHREAARRLVSAVATIALCCVPLAVLAAERGSAQLFWVPSPSLRTAKQLLDALASSGLQPGYYVTSGNALLILTGVLVVLWVGRSASRLRRAERDAGADVLLVCWLVVPIVLALAISLLGHSIFQARYALVSLPALALVLAGVVTRGGWPPVLAVVAAVALIALRALALAPSYGVSTEQWRSATAYVAAARHPHDCIAFYPEDARMPFAYYRTHQPSPTRSEARAALVLPRPVLPALPWTQVRPYVEEYVGLSVPRLATIRGGCRRLWLVWSHEGHLGGPPVSAANFRRLLDLRAELAGIYPVRMTRTFGRASPISVELFRAAA